MICLIIPDTKHFCYGIPRNVLQARDPMTDMFDGQIPEYRLRISRRARRVNIRVSPAGQVEVVVPQGFDPAEVPCLLRQRRDWLEQVFARIEKRQQQRPDTHGLQPRRIELPAAGESWRVDYSREYRRALVIRRHERRLVLSQENSAAASAGQLRQWLQKCARQILSPWLRQVSAELNLPFGKVTVRGQKTRWGSCSKEKNISLNRNLLFLPPKTVHYLFVHELCHTVHMNHSAEFWRRVADCMPDFRQHEKVLRHAARTLPLWVYA